ncbi:MAG: hypothetical protein WD670_07030 [Actinomycetota bacterium]
MNVHGLHLEIYFFFAVRFFLAVRLVLLVTRVAARLAVFSDLPVAALGVTFFSAISIHLPRICGPSRA